MAGLTAANKLYTSPGSRESFEVCVVEGGNRIGGRINTSEFCGDRIEMGATWIHGIEGSPIHKIAQEINSLESEQPWEGMDGFLDDPVTLAENGYELNPSIVEPVTSFFNKLMDFAKGSKGVEDGLSKEDIDFFDNVRRESPHGKLSVGSFLRKGLDAYQGSKKGQEELEGYGSWTRKLLEEAIFAINEYTQRTYTSAGDLGTLDYNAESEYRMFPGEEITIAKGYMSIINFIASFLPSGSIQLGRKVAKIEWQPESHHELESENGHDSRPVKLHFSDGSIMRADHVIVTVSLGVLKSGIQENEGMFDPQLPNFKKEAISRLGFGVVNKLFLQLSPNHDRIPYLQMAFHRPESKFRNQQIPWWMRKTAFMCPIYGNSSVLISWFAGKEALELESLNDEEVISGVSTTISSFQPYLQTNGKSSNSHRNLYSVESSSARELKFTKCLKSKWANDPLFLGSYSYVAVGSSGEDLDTMAMPLPKHTNFGTTSPLQILFAGEATHRTHYSTTHGAYFSGIREANRLLQHYNCNGV